MVAIELLGGATLLGIGALMLAVPYFIGTSKDSDEAGARAEGAGESLMSAVGSVIGGLVRGVIKMTPFGSKFWKAMIGAGFKNYRKKTGADAIGLDALPNGKIHIQPVKWKKGTSEGEKPGWKAMGRDKTWAPTADGQKTSRIGKTPVIPLDEDAEEAGNMLQCRVGEAVALGNTRELYRADDGNLTATVNLSGQPGNAVADGGAQVEDMRFNPGDSPVFEDIIIDIGSGEGFDGQAISYSRYSDMYPESTDSEEMQRQEDRGEIAGMSRRDMKSVMIKLMIIAALVALGGLIGPELVQALLGGGGGGSGGGGGGLIPIALGVF